MDLQGEIALLHENCRNGMGGTIIKLFKEKANKKLKRKSQNRFFHSNE